MLAYLQVKQEDEHYHESNSTKQRNPHHPLITLNPLFVIHVKERDGTENARRNELNGPIFPHKPLAL